MTWRDPCLNATHFIFAPNIWQSICNRPSKFHMNPPSGSRDIEWQSWVPPTLKNTNSKNILHIKDLNDIVWYTTLFVNTSLHSSAIYVHDTKRSSLCLCVVTVYRVKSRVKKKKYCIFWLYLGIGLLWQCISSRFQWFLAVFYWLGLQQYVANVWNKNIQK